MLGGREFIEPDGGMIFVFPRARVLQFVMRDCLVPIDIIFLDPAGRVIATHQMAVEEPRRENESEIAYESRLNRYSSRYTAQFAIELAGGTLDSLAVQTGQRVGIDTEALKKLAR